MTDPVSEQPAKPVEPTQPAQPPPAEPKKSPLSGLAMWAAVGALVVWLGFSVVLLFQTDATEVIWTRVAWVYGSVQAIAFAAAGALFGTAVSRDSVEKAEERADAATTEAEANKNDATRGKVLAAAVQAEAAVVAPRGGDEGEVRAFAGGSAPATEVDKLDVLSRRLFGDLV